MCCTYSQVVPVLNNMSSFNLNYVQPFFIYYRCLSPQHAVCIFHNSVVPCRSNQSVVFNHFFHCIYLLPSFLNVFKNEKLVVGPVQELESHQIWDLSVIAFAPLSILANFFIKSSSSLNGKLFVVKRKKSLFLTQKQLLVRLARCICLDI